jgi:steroid delta-isomerase-like uncharacterized protein
MQIPQVIRTYVETFKPGGLEAWLSTFASDGTYTDPNVPHPTPADGLKDHFAGLFSGFPDARFELVGLDAISERVWVWRWIMHGTNSASFRGLPATGRAVALPGCEIIEIRGDRVHRVQGYFDRMTILSQLGLAPVPVARPENIAG